MINREMIIKGLEARGYAAEPFCVLKNGIEAKGIKILTDEKYSPAFYTDDIIDYANENGHNLEHVIDDMVCVLHKDSKMQLVSKDLWNKNFIVKHVYIGLQKTSCEDIIKREVGCLYNIESYLFVRKDIDEAMSCVVKVTQDIIRNADITLDEIWKSAENNTFKDTVLISMQSIFNQKMEYPVGFEEEYPMHILTNKQFVKGASAILNVDVLEKFSETYNTKIIVAIPSSIHEFIIMPYDEDMDIKYLDILVKEVNKKEVRPEEQLADTAFLIDIEKLSAEKNKAER